MEVKRGETASNLMGLIEFCDEFAFQQYRTLLV